jgi:hypothetical protein
MGAGVGQSGRVRLLAWLDRPGQSLPVLVGIAALLGALALVVGRGDRVPALQATFFAALALIAAGIALYFLLGFWLIPADLVLGGIVIDSAREWLLDAPGSAIVGSAVFVALGILFLAIGARPARAPAAPGPSTPPRPG